MSSPLLTPEQRSALSRFGRGVVRAYHGYATWLVSIGWGRFLVLSLLLLIAAGVAQNLPPFSWHYSEIVTVDDAEATPPEPPPPPTPPKRKALIQIEQGDEAASGASRGLDIVVGGQGIRIRSVAAASAPASSASAAEGPEVRIDAGREGVRIQLPPGADADEVRAAVEEARDAIVEAIEEKAQAEAQAQAQAQAAARQAASSGVKPRTITRNVRYGDSLPELAFFWIIASALLKSTYKGRLQAEVKAAQATETAEAESLKRQVVEARMAAMQAQVEPHFLFNTLASIDHLIETDPARASLMQKNLIALLRASMPTLRETGDGAARDLGRELAVVRPYLEILKVRMEERLDAQIDVPEGLLSAEFPSMMIQTLVENAIRHGLEPKPEGGQLRVSAEIVHGALQVRVADTGVGFGQAATSGTGVGLDNIRERLKLLHGPRASLTVAAHQPCGTVVTVTVPYRTVGVAAGASA
jgi:hypothetical protein